MLIYEISINGKRIRVESMGRGAAIREAKQIAQARFGITEVKRITCHLKGRK